MQILFIFSVVRFIVKIKQWLERKKKMYKKVVKLKEKRIDNRKISAVHRSVPLVEHTANSLFSFICTLYNALLNEIYILRTFLTRSWTISRMRRDESLNRRVIIFQRTVRAGGMKTQPETDFLLPFSFWSEDKIRMREQWAILWGRSWKGTRVSEPVLAVCMLAFCSYLADRFPR